VVFWVKSEVSMQVKRLVKVGRGSAGYHPPSTLTSILTQCLTSVCNYKVDFDSLQQGLSDGGFTIFLTCLPW
jgi:hypothetical protein